MKDDTSGNNGIALFGQQVKWRQRILAQNKFWIRREKIDREQIRRDKNV